MTGDRLLVIDDEADFGTFVGRVAGKMGFEVRVTTKPKEFMTTFEQFDPTVIVVDILMPEVDGIELLQWLKTKQCKARVVIVSGYSPLYTSMAEAIGTFAEFASIERLAKPVPLAKLEAALKGLKSA